MQMDEQTKYWVGFNFVKGIGSVRMRALLDLFGDARTAWQAPVSDLQRAGLGPKTLETLVKVRTAKNLDQVWEQLQAHNIKVYTWEDENYPHHLMEASQPPPVLYVRGCLVPEDDWAISIVGTRRITAYGRQVTDDAAARLSTSGVTIVSGLARGVDAVAHQAALRSGGRTLAVLGCGIDRVYPPEHQRLAEQIIKQGALISDYPPGTPPDAVNFPPRNRIISGLSRAVIVVEAGKNSGALITAAFAAEQGREVFAVPGNIYAPQSQGTNLLIQQGARPYLNAQDVLDILDLSQVVEHQAARSVLPADATEARLLGLLGVEPLHVDEIRAQADLPIDTVSATLVMMELKGMVRQVGGMQYVAVREVVESYQVD